MAISAARLQVDVKADTASAERNLTGLGNTVGKAPKVFGAAKMAAVGLGLGFAAAATGAVTMGIKTASNLQQADIAFTTMLGSGQKAEKFLGDLQKFAAATPFEFPDLVSASQRLLAMGFAAKDVVPTLTAIGDAVAGLGGGKEQIDQVSRALGQMQAKGKIQSDELLQLTEAGIPALKILADTYGVTTGEMQEMVTKGKVLADKAIPALVSGLEKGTKSTAGFGGMMEKQSHTMAGAWSTLMDTFNMGMANVLKPLIPLISSALPAVTGALSGAFTGFSGALSVGVGWISTIVGVLPGLWAVITGGMGGVTASASGLSSLLDGVRSGFTDMAADVMGIVAPAWAALVAAWNGNVLPALQGLLSAVAGMLPGLQAFATVVINVATYVGGLLARGLQTVLPVLVAIGGILVGVVIGAFSALFTVVGQVAGALGSAAGFIGAHSQAFAIAAGIITAVFIPAMVAAGIRAAAQAALTVAGWIAQGVAAVASGALTAAIWVMLTASSIAGAAAQGLSVVKVVAGWVLMGVQAMIGAARMAAAWLIALGPIGLVIAAVIAITVLVVKNWDTISKATSKAWAAITGWVSNAWNAITAKVSSAVTATKAIVVAVFAAIGSAISAYVNAWRSVITAVWNAIRSIVTGAVNGVRSAVSSAFGAVTGAISGAMNGARNVVSSAWNGIRSAFSGGASGAIGIVRSLPGRILGALGAVGSMLYNAGASIIRGLADGIRNGLGAVTGAVKNVLSAARDLLPFSPAKTGPFSGKGWTLYSGRSISAALARGLMDNTGAVRTAARIMATAAVPALGGVEVPGLAFGRSSAARGARGPSAAGMSGGQNVAPSGVVINMTAYNPVAEAQSVTTNKTLQRVAALGLVG